MSNNNFPVVLVGPPGVGKTTLYKEIIKKINIKTSISATTRKPRKGEIEGKDYYFLTMSEFNKWIKEKKFFEYAKVYDNYYGTPKEPFLQYLKNGSNVLLELDIQGAKSIKKQFPSAVLIFIMPPSIDELKNRIEKRKSGDIAKLKYVDKEIENSKLCDYIVMNDKLESAVNKIISIIIAEECSVKRLL